mgnify:CR=1 FL=1
MIRIQRLRNNVPNPDPEIVQGGDDEVRETTVDGQTFSWAPGQVRNFLDDGVGIAHGAFDGNEDADIETGLFATNGQSRA